MPDNLESGEVCVAAPIEESPEWLRRACHEIIDAASALMVNVDYLAYEVDSKKRGAAEDAKRSIERIVKIAEGLRRVSRAEKAA